MLRRATLDDFDFIFSLTLLDARKGHYDRRVESIPAATNGLRVELLSILRNSVRVNGLIAQPLIQDHNGVAAGFLILSAGENNAGNELWMASIAPEFRGRGLGRAMIEELTGQLGKNKGLFLCARCAPESEIMFGLLKKCGFRHEDTAPLGTRMLIFEG